MAPFRMIFSSPARLQLPCKRSHPNPQKKEKKLKKERMMETGCPHCHAYTTNIIIMYVVLWILSQA